MRTSNVFKRLPAWILGASLCLGTASVIAGDPVWDFPADPGVGAPSVFELENSDDGGNAIDQNDVTGTAAAADPAEPYPDDWGKIATINNVCVDPDGGPTPASCGHVSGPEDPADPTAGDPNDTASLDGHDGANSIEHGFVLDPDGTANMDTIFVMGGSKDDLDISEWRHDLGSVPDKDDLLPVGSAAYTPIVDFGIDGVAGGGDDITNLLIYFFGTLFAPNGDAALGAWFFKNPVVACPNGTFGVINPASGTCEPTTHENGDILIQADTTNGGRQVNMRIFAWVGNFPAADRAAECALIHPGATLVPPKDNLCELEDIVDATCGTGSLNDACGSMNLRDSESPDTWGFMSKFPPTPSATAWPPGTGGIHVDDFPRTSFFEGGINVSELVPGDLCFSSFMLNTRSSQRIRAQLKDFALGKFEICSSDLRTEIHAADDHDSDVQVTENNPTSAVNAGVAIHDAAFVKAVGPTGVPAPTGTVTFDKYAATCALITPLLTDDNDMNDPDMVGSHTVDLSLGTLIDGEIRVESDQGTGGVRDTPDPGAWAYWVTYSGDLNYPPAGPHCEEVAINQLNSTTVTRIHDSTATPHVTVADILNIPDIQGGDSLAVKVGITVHDLAIVTGQPSEALPTGTVDFTLYSNDSCTPGDLNANVLQTWSGVSLTTGTTNSIAESGNYMPTFVGIDADVRKISFKAAYNGSTLYKPSTGVCEPLTIEKRQPQVETHVILLDRAKVSPDASSVTPTGTVVFKVYGNGTCNPEGDPGLLLTTDPVALATVDSMQIARMLQTDESIVTTTGTSSLSYEAIYSGDDTYVSTTHACEVINVTLPAPTTGSDPTPPPTP